MIELLAPVFEHFLTMEKHWAVETNIPWARYHPYIQNLTERVRVAHAGCTASRARISIQPGGEVTSCLCMSEPPWQMGNVRKDDLRTLFADSPQSQLFAKPWEHGICTGCEHLGECGGGCRAMAYCITGRLDADDPTCPLQKKTLRQT